MQGIVSVPRKIVFESLSPERKEAKEDFTRSPDTLRCLLCFFV